MQGEQIVKITEKPFLKQSVRVQQDFEKQIELCPQSAKLANLQKCWKSFWFRLDWKIKKTRASKCRDSEPVSTVFSRDNWTVFNGISFYLKKLFMAELMCFFVKFNCR